MSGDVQPRKRKDKRKKKEGSSLGAIHEPVSSAKFKRSESDDLKIFDVPDQGEKIHIQSEHGIGGNIFVKIIFFCLFGLLVGAVGLIYWKSQGSTDVDLPTIEESRFAEYFTGWLDDSTDDHEHEALESNLHHEEHNDHLEHDEHEDHDDGDEDHEQEHEEEEDQSAEQDSIFKLFGLQESKPDEADESAKEDKVTESESELRQNAKEDESNEEEKEEEDEKEKDDTEEEEDEKEKDDTEEEEDEKEKDDTEEEEDEEKGQDAMEEDEEEKNEVEDTEENEDADEEENDKENNGNEGQLYFDEQESEEDEDHDEDEDYLSQVDEEEEDEDLHYASQMKKNFRNQAGKLKVNKKDDDEDEVEEKTLSGEEKLGDEKNSKGEGEESNEQKNYEEKKKKQKGSEENKSSKFNAENDDLGFEEIEVSEEDLQDIHRPEEKDVSEKEKLFAEVIKNKEYDLQIQKEEEEAKEEDTGGVALKLGVGIALIFVAHLVLVKKWKSMSNVPSDENIQTVAETASERKEVQNLELTFEPVISRRQTLVPKDVCLNDEVEDEEELEEEEEEEEEEEDGGGDEIYEEDIEEVDFKKSNIVEVGTVEKPRWNIQGNKKENDELLNEFEEEDEEEEGEDEYEEDDVEEIEEEPEPEDEQESDNYEEDLEEEVEDDCDDLKNKMPLVVEKEEMQETAPIPPPRTRGGRGAQETVEDSIYFKEIKEAEETIQDNAKGDDINNNSGPEEPKTPEKKVGNEDEWAFRQELDFADEQFENNPKAAMRTYDKILSKKPTLIRALIGRARTLDNWAEKEKSNAYLKQATDAYKTLLLNHGHRLDDATYVKLAERCIERMRFAGNLVSAIDILKALILKYPNTPKYRNTLAVTYLMLNKIPQARVLLNETLSLWPKDGFALVHYGFILKTSDNNMEEGVKKLIAGIQTREEGVIDGMFFFHLGDALNRLGRVKEAMSWYEMGVKEGLFLSKYQRSLYNVNRLKGQPWWSKEETTYQDFFKKLEDNWREIRKEGLELLNSKGVKLFKEEAENLKDTGDWRQLDLYYRGRKQANCNKAPVTCSLVSSFKPAATCTRGQIKFSVMLPNTHVWPHCGPTNCRLRSHLGLVVPKNTFIRVAEETRSWEEGKFIIFDDSFEHEVWHNGTGPRLVLIVDVWHPELTSHERRYLSPI